MSHAIAMLRNNRRKDAEVGPDFALQVGRMGLFSQSTVIYYLAVGGLKVRLAVFVSKSIKPSTFTKNNRVLLRIK